MAIKRDILIDKLFDPRFYKTMYISKADEEKANAEHVEMLVELLCDTRYKASRQEIFNFLKKEPKAVELLLRAIAEAKGDKKVLVAACWESNIDCTPFLPFFTHIVIHDNFEVAMEALTVIEHITGEVNPQQANELIAKVKEGYTAQSETPKAALLLDLVELLRRWA
ncbi:MAG: hypothetical protein ACLQQ4_15720 [Bacteroidia bacterium]